MGAIFIIIGLLFDMMATSIPIVVIGSVMVALGFGLFNSSDAALVMRILPNMDNAGKDVGIMASANNLQGVLIPMLAPMLLGIGSWYAFFGGVSIFVILGIIILYTIPEDPRYKASLEEQTIKEVIVK
ncbi:Arabinose efflux permease [Listeria grayi]|uniref:Arabinose efflux permease n=1 Tax=Listeria grayi TaxID=1641 RepID=A0A378MMQ6_LISGR|nr:MFS transporter [Listeria grayi]STY44995.1 Arabinose efflux permease [Listeria grayi]